MAADRDPRPEGDLVGRLKGVQNNFVLGLAAISLLSRPEARAVLEQERVQFGGFDVPLAQVAEMLARPADRDEHIKQFAIVLMRDLVTLSFELAREHSKTAGILDQMRAEPWYDFAAVIRNCLSHNFRVSYSPRQRSALPIQWQDRAFTPEMDRGPLPLEFFSWAHAWRLFVDIRTFAERVRV